MDGDFIDFSKTSKTFQRLQRLFQSLFKDLNKENDFYLVDADQELVGPLAKVVCLCVAVDKLIRGCVGAVELLDG